MLLMLYPHNFNGMEGWVLQLNLVDYVYLRDEKFN